MKKTLAIILTLLTVLSLFGCSSKDYKQGKAVFEKDGITLTLTNAFKETDLYPILDTHAAYTSGEATVAVFKEKSGEADKLSAKEYADKWRLANVKFSPEPIKEEKRTVSTTYKASFRGENTIFYTAFYVSDEAFWIVQFFCAEDVYEEYAPYFAKWAGKIKVS